MPVLRRAFKIRHKHVNRQLNYKADLIKAVVRVGLDTYTHTPFLCFKGKEIYPEEGFWYNTLQFPAVVFLVDNTKACSNHIMSQGTIGAWKKPGDKTGYFSAIVTFKISK